MSTLSNTFVVLAGGNVAGRGAALEGVAVVAVGAAAGRGRSHLAAVQAIVVAARITGLA